MPRSSDSYQHHLDTCYEVWRNGGNPDSVSSDQSANEYWDGYTPRGSASAHLRRTQERREEQEAEDTDEAYGRFDLTETELDEDEPHRCERLGCENSDATFYSDAGMHLCHDCRARAEQ